MASEKPNYRSDLEMWCDMWDEVESEFSHKEKIKPSTAPGTGKAQDYYYDLLELEEEQMFQEVKTPNPVYPDSVGADSKTTPAVWADENLLKEIEGLRKKLDDVENRVAKLGGENKWSEKALVQKTSEPLKEIDSLRKRISEISDKLGIKHEPSPWDTDQVKTN